MRGVLQPYIDFRERLRRADLDGRVRGEYR